MDEYLSSDVAESCLTLMKKLETLHHSSEDEKEFAKTLPDLFLQIFGFVGERQSWVSESLKNLNTCNLLVKLLDPEGPLFALVLKYSDQNTGSATYPHDHLSLLSTSLIGSRGADRSFPFYSNRLSQSDEGNIRLDLFEYYFFLFSAFVVYRKYDFQTQYSNLDVLRSSVYQNPFDFVKTWVKNRKKQKTQIILERHLEYEDPFRKLLEMYLDFFFPMNPNDEAVFEDGGSRSPPRWRKGKRGKKNYYRVKHQDNRYFKDMKMRFLHIVTDFWLCNWSVLNDKVEFHRTVLDNPVLLLGSCISLVKHLLCTPQLQSKAKRLLRGFGGGGNMSPRRTKSPRRSSMLMKAPGSNLPSPLTPPLEFVRYYLYRFLHVMFTSFPRKGTRKPMPILGVTTLWMTFAQPWRLFDDFEFDRWVPFIVSNWVFYSSLFIDFLEFVTEHFHESSTNMIMKVKEVLELFSEEEFVRLLHFVDNYLEKSKRGDDRISPLDRDESGMVSIGKIRMRGMRYFIIESDILQEHLRECLGSTHNYESIFSARNTKLAGHLHELCVRSIGVVKSSKIRDGQGSPLKSFFMSKEEKRRMKMGDAKEGMESIAKSIASIFGLESGKERRLSPIKGRKLNFGDDEDKNIISKRPKKKTKFEELREVDKKKKRLLMEKEGTIARNWDNGPMRYQKNGKLTDSGREELRRGRFVCRNRRIPRFGHPVDFPIRDTEIHILVPTIQMVSKKLEKIGKKLRIIPCNLVVTRVERVNLRFLAKRKLYIFLIIFFLLFWWVFYF